MQTFAVLDENCDFAANAILNWGFVVFYERFCLVIEKFIILRGRKFSNISLGQFFLYFFDLLHTNRHSEDVVAH